ncbi:Ribosomal lysine N-methyltransferase 4 [Exophiala xenobiotica]|nr:Ribosomal lysine N-methyltransferase 4 [Exophiala xenobiotica]
MGEDTILGLCFLAFFLSILTSPLWITACIAAAVTRKWSKEKTRRVHNDIEGVEADRLVEDSESGNEEEFLDSEDEDYYRAQQDRKREERQEQEADLLLSTRAKFFKEWKKCWSTGDKIQLAKERELKEQDERRKIAREAVREYLRIERRKARMAGTKSEAGMELPSYGNAVAQDFEVLSASYLNWFNTQPGTNFHPSLKIVDLRARNAGRGIIATADIPADTDLFAIPRRVIISEETSELATRLPELFPKSEDVIDEVDQDGLPSELPKPWLNLILILLYESLHHSTSKWSPYLSILPQRPSSFDTLMFWSDQELEELQASAMPSKIGKDLADYMFKTRIIPVVKQHANVFYPAGSSQPSDEELLGACHVIGSLIMSYAFDLQPDDDDADEDDENDDGWVEDHFKPSPMGMVPMADMLNADAEFNAHLSHGDDSLTMTSLRDIKAGEEILNYYGPLPNGELLRRYGYTSPKHSRYDVVEVSWDLVKKVLSDTEAPYHSKSWSERLDKIMKDIEQDGEFDADDGFVIELDAGDPNEQGLCTTEAKFANFPEELVAIITDLVSKFSKDEIKQKNLSDQSKSSFIKSRILVVLSQILRRRLEQYPTSSEQDAVLLDDSRTKGRLRMAVDVRLGEKKILEEALTWTEGKMEKYKGVPEEASVPEPHGQPPRKKQRMAR